MKRQEAKVLYQSFKKNATFSSFDMYFNDTKKQIFIKEFPIGDSRLVNYSDFWNHSWENEEGVINKGHPIIGSIIGNMIGGFGTGFVGALAGQEMQGRQVPYVADERLTLFMKDQTFIEHYLFHGTIKKNSYMWRDFKKQIDELDTRFYHAEGLEAPGENPQDVNYW